MTLNSVIAVTLCNFTEFGYILMEIRAKFVYEGYRIKFKVTGAKRRRSLFPQCKTSIGNKSGSIKDTSVKFACSVGFSAMADRMM